MAALVAKTREEGLKSLREKKTKELAGRGA